MVNCPACEAELDLDEEQLEEGGVVSCGDCGANFEIVNTHPLELNLLGDDENDEDLDDDFDEDEDEDLDDEDEDDEDDDEDDEDLDDDEEDDDE